MRLISCHNGKLQHLAEAGLKLSPERTFRTGLPHIDQLAGGSLARGAVHELLAAPDHGQPFFLATILARAASASSPLIWSDPRNELYPPALIELGVDLRSVFLLHPDNPADELWALCECLKCKGVGAVVAPISRLTRLSARRIQLAAETGGTTAILLRPNGTGSQIYAAATRWLVAPAPGERSVQRWMIQLLHGHGGRVGQSVFLEYCREKRVVRSSEKLVDRQAAPAIAGASA